MSGRPRCDLGHELDFIGHNHVEPDEMMAHADPNDPESVASYERTVAARKAYIERFWAERDADR